MEENQNVVVEPEVVEPVAPAVEAPVEEAPVTPEVDIVTEATE